METISEPVRRRLSNPDAPQSIRAAFARSQGRFTDLQPVALYRPAVCSG